MSLDASNPAILKAVKDLVGPAGKDRQWVCFGYEPKIDKIKVKATGSDGVKDLSDNLGEGQVLFIYSRYDVAGVAKYACIGWLGEAVTGIRSAKYPKHFNDFKDFLKRNGCPFHTEINARSEVDVDEKVFLGKLKSAMGSAYDTAQKSSKIQGFSDGAKSVKDGHARIAQTKESTYKTDTGYSSGGAIKDREAFWKENSTPIPSGGAVSSGGKASEAASLASKRGEFWGKNPTVAPAPKDAGEETSYETPEPAPYYEPVPAPAPVPKGIKAASVPIPKAAEPEPEPEAPAAEWSEPAADGYYDSGAVAHAEPAYDESAGAYDESAGYIEPTAAAADGEQVRAIADYPGENEGDLPITTGDIITVLDKSDPSGWWQGTCNGNTGYFPSNYVEPM